MACSYRIRALALLALLAVASASHMPPAASSASSSSSQRGLLASSAITPSNPSDTIAVPRVSLGSILSSILKWPSNVLSGFGSWTAPASASGTGNNDLFSAAADENSTGGASAASSSTSSSSSSTGSSQSPPTPPISEPLTDTGIAAINRLLAGNQSSNGPYHFDTGLPPLQDLVVMNTTAQATASTLSADRIQRLSHLSEPLGWVIRSFAVSGEALLKLKLSTDLQLIIRDVISNSIAASAAVPEEQVLTFAASNVSISLGFNGVDWPSTAANGVDWPSTATSDQHPGLSAVRAALAHLAGDFDPEHINVSLQDPAAASTAAGSPPGRRMLQAAAAPAAVVTPEVVVYATFYSLDPANSTSLLEALGKRCSTASQNSSSNPGNPVFAPLVALVPGTDLTSSCMAQFHTEFIQQGVPVSSKGFAVTPVNQPQATIDLSVAVGLTNAQTVNNLDQRTGDWLNSTALDDILAEFNLTAVPTEFTEFVWDPETGRFPEIPGLNLSSLMAKLMSVPGRDGNGAAAKTAGLNPGKSGVVGKAIIAGVTVAAVTSVLALAGVAYLLVRHRRAAAQATEGQLPTSTGGAPGSSDSNRRRRRRPRVYNNKYISGTDTGSHGTDTAASQSDTIPAAAEPPKHHLERGDSVSSAVKFEADGPVTLDSETATPTSSAAESSSSSSVLQQPVTEMQLYRAAGPSCGSGAASAYSLLHDRVGSTALTETPRSSHSRELLSNGVGLALGGSVAPAAAVAASHGERNVHLLHEQQQQQTCWGMASAPYGFPGVPIVSSSSSNVTSRAYSMQRSVSATLLADAAAAVLAQKALARSQSAAAQSNQVYGSTNMLQHPAVAMRTADQCDVALQPKTVGVSATSTPPATPVADAAAVFAAMDTQLAAAAAARSSGGCSSSSRQGVQPLGASCWHSRGHESGFLVPEGIAAAGQPAMIPYDHQQQGIGQYQPQQQQQPQRPHTSGGWVSAFSMVEQQQQYGRTSGCGSLSRFAVEQQRRQSRHSGSGGAAAMVSPFASEKEQQRVSGSGCGNVAASFVGQNSSSGGS